MVDKPDDMKDLLAEQQVESPEIPSSNEQEQLMELMRQQWAESAARLRGDFEEFRFPDPGCSERIPLARQRHPGCRLTHVWRQADASTDERKSCYEVRDKAGNVQAKYVEGEVLSVSDFPETFQDLLALNTQRVCAASVQVIQQTEVARNMFNGGVFIQAMRSAFTEQELAALRDDPQFGLKFHGHMTVLSIANQTIELDIQHSRTVATLFQTSMVGGIWAALGVALPVVVVDISSLVDGYAKLAADARQRELSAEEFSSEISNFCANWPVQIRVGAVPMTHDKTQVAYDLLNPTAPLLNSRVWAAIYAPDNIPSFFQRVEDTLLGPAHAAKRAQQQAVAETLKRTPGGLVLP